MCSREESNAYAKFESSKNNTYFVIVPQSNLFGDPQTKSLWHTHVASSCARTAAVVFANIS